MAQSLRKIVTEFRKGLLDGRDSVGWCRAVCLPLQGYLSMVGHETKVIEGVVDFCGEDFEHVWLKLSDGRIIDPTADQFNQPTGEAMPAVYIGKMPDWYKC